MLTVLESTDAFRRPERLSQFLLACEADAQSASKKAVEGLRRQLKELNAALKKRDREFTALQALDTISMVGVELPNGETVSLDRPPERVVSLVPSTTETRFASASLPSCDSVATAESDG